MNAAYDSFQFEIDSESFIAELHPDIDTGAPWEEHDGHGPVSEWTTRSKLPGELILNREGPHRRYYDYQEACRIARKDGWGFLPEPVRVHRPEGRPGALPTYSCGDFHIVSDDPNLAYSDLYAQHRESMTAREYAAGAAMRDFKRLRAWCDDEWHWCGIVVRRRDACPCCGDSESLWGIESDAGDYLQDVARELAEEILYRERNAA